MKKQTPTLGDIYGDMLKGVKVVVTENAQENINKSKKVPKQPKNAFSDKNTLTKGGPQEKSGYRKALNDDCPCEEDEETQFDPELQKKSRNRLNNFMTKKSTFDKLFESVMGGAFDNQEDAQEVDALGLGDAPTDDEFGSEDGMEEDGDQITVTMSRSVAHELIELLQAAVGEGGSEEMEDEGLDFDGEDDFGSEDGMEEDAEEQDGDDDEMDYEEDEESGVFPTDKVGNDGTVGTKDGKGSGQKHSLQGKNNKVSGKPQPKNQGTKVVGTTDKVGNDGDYGHALHGAKQPDMGKQNKVSDIRQAEDFFR